MGEVYTLVILKTKSLQDFTQLQVWGLLLAASFLLLLLELAADKVYRKPQAADKPKNDIYLDMPSRK